jgi:hypothetical protein
MDGESVADGCRGSLTLWKVGALEPHNSSLSKPNLIGESWIITRETTPAR